MIHRRGIPKRSWKRFRTPASLPSEPRISWRPCGLLRNKLPAPTIHFSIDSRCTTDNAASSWDGKWTKPPGLWKNSKEPREQRFHRNSYRNSCVSTANPWKWMPSSGPWTWKRLLLLLLLLVRKLHRCASKSQPQILHSARACSRFFRMECNSCDNHRCCLLHNLVLAFCENYNSGGFEISINRSQ